MEEVLPLEGIRVVDLTVMLQGPIAAAILADLGAEVIKVEKPGVGDPVRGLKTVLHGPNMLPNGRSHLFGLGNRNKKGVALNLHHAGGREALYRLIERSDAMLTNLLPAALLEMGADKETVQKVNPGLVYVHGRGYGARGPLANRPCMDTSGMARSGFMFNDSRSDGDPLWYTGGISDIMTATVLAFGAVTGLMAKERTGKARVVNASQVSSMMWLGMQSIGTFLNFGVTTPAFDRRDAYSPLMNIYKCSDGKWIAMANSTSIHYVDRIWHDFCEVAGQQHLEYDPRFDTGSKRIEMHRELIEILDGIFRTKSAGEWQAIFEEKEIACSIVNRYSDLPGDPQIEENGYLMELDDGMKAVALPFELEGVSLPRRACPEHGQHTEEILETVCGYSWKEISELREKGAIW